MTDEEYIKFARSLSKTCDDPYSAAMVLLKYKDVREELVDYVKKNRLDMTYLRDYSRNGWERYSDNWKKFILKFSKLTKEHGIGEHYVDIDEDDEG